MRMLQVPSYFSDEDAELPVRLFMLRDTAPQSGLGGSEVSLSSELCGGTLGKTGDTRVVFPGGLW